MAQAAGEVSRATGRSIPPYVPYSTFRDFLNRIKGKVPGRIDRSLMSSMSETIGSQLIAALRYLGMVSREGVPTEALRRLVKAEDAERPRVLREILTGSYRFLFEDFDVERATTAQIEKRFKETGASGDTVRKCVAFFLAAGQNAGIQLSPYIKPYKGIQRSTRAPSSAEPLLVETSRAPNVADRAVDSLRSGNLSGLQQALLSKFPNFDPAWPDDVKAKWLDDFRELWRSAGAGTKTGRPRTRSGTKP